MGDRRPPRLGAALLIAATVGGCGLNRWLLPDVEPFPTGAQTVTLDFETRDLGAIPESLVVRSGRWSVVDYPEAASGQQVLVQRSDEAARLALTGNAGDETRGEVSLRVVLGEAGAGIGCLTPSGNGVAFKAEPERKRVGLYRVDESSAKPIVTETVKTLAKGNWTRLAILCRPGSVIGFVDGTPVVEDDASVESAELALHADAGMTVQFDDLRYVVE